MCFDVLQVKRNTEDDYDLANDANAKVSSACRTNVTNSKKARDYDYEMSRMQGLLNGVRANFFHTQNSEDAAKVREKKALAEKKAAEDELKNLQGQMRRHY